MVEVLRIPLVEALVNMEQVPELVVSVELAVVVNIKMRVEVTLVILK